MRKCIPEISYNYSRVRTLTKAVLVALGFGALLFTALVAPNAIQLFRPLLRRGKRKNYDRERIKQSVRLLERRRLVEFVEDKSSVIVRLTDKGRQYLEGFEINNISLPVDAWDGKWRIIMFDIPESRGSARRAFQRRLQLLGCCPLQKSAFVYPHPCRQEIELLTSYWNIGGDVHYIETKSLDYSEKRARRFFGLPVI